MAITLTELATMRDTLQRAIFSGTRRVQFENRAVEYNSVADMQKALAVLDAQISTTSGISQSPFSLAMHSRD